MNPKMIAVSAIIILAVSGGSFYGGMKYEQSQSPASKFANRNFQQGANATGTKNVASRTNGGGVAGEIISKDDKSITVKLHDGGSKIIFLSETTKTTKSAQTDGTAADLAVGKQVSITGTANSDGSINASNIQLISSLPAVPGGSEPPAGE